MNKVFTWRLLVNASQKTEVMLFQVLAPSSDEARLKLLHGPFLSNVSVKDLATQWIQQASPIENEPDGDCWILKIDIGLQTAA
jgi:hypothetical protein